MSVALDDLVKALRAGLGRAGEWVVRERRRSSLARELGSGDTSQELEHRFDVIVYRDSREGRGESTLSIDPAADLSLDTEISAALARAAADDGPLWSLPRPAAPARVELVDERLVAEPDAAIAELGATLRAVDKKARIARGSITASTTSVRVLTSSELDRSYRATAIAVDALMLSGSHRLRLSAPMRIRARRLADIDLASRLEATSASLAAEASANPVPPGVYDLIVDTAALERCAAGDFGWLAPLAAQASGSLARRGLSRYQPGQSVYGDREVTGDRLTLSSDGALDFGWRSAPFADHGEAVRRFALIERGVAAGLGLDAREASLRNALPNGGVCNLQLQPGKRTLAELATGERQPLIVRELTWVEVDATTGDLALELRLARFGNGPALRGGQLAGNLFDWLPHLRLGAETYQTPSYRGPRWIAVPAVAVG